MSAPLIKFKQVSKFYGETPALRQASFSIDSGEFVFLVGPSGAGKSTLIRLLIRQELPSEGEIFYEDIPLSQLKDRFVPLLRQEVGVVFQDFKLIATKTVKENVLFGLEALGYPPEEREKAVKKALQLVGLWERRRSFPAQLSGGEAQRVAIARSVALHPKVFIADEPTGNIDPDLTDNLFKVFEKINKQGITVIVATHDEKEVDQMKKRVIALERGRVVRDKKVGKYHG